MDTNLDKILCAVDFSKFSNPLVDYASGLARGLDAHLTVFHALSSPLAPLHEASGCRPDTSVAEQITDASTRIEKLMAQRPVRWDVAVRYGDAVETIADFTRENGIGLVVAASYGLSGWKRFLLGTVVETLSRTLNRPFLVVRPPRKKASAQPGAGPLQMNNILICCDLSPATLALYPFADKLAQHFAARLHIVHAMETPVREDLVDPTSGPYTEVQHRLQVQLLERLCHQVPSSVRQDDRITPAVVSGNAKDSLRDYAMANAIDLIIVGVRPRGSLHKILVGSTTESMVRQAPCNVLTIPCGPANG